MISLRLTILAFALTALFLGSPGPIHAQTAEGASANDMARFLAGMEPSQASPLAQFGHNRSWQSHARHFDSAWKSIDQRQLAKIRQWSAANLTEPSPTLLYMFGGPDFLYAESFFPGASTYVLSGLEPVGPVPEMTPALRRALPHALDGLRASLSSVLNYSFFRTKDMREQLRATSLNGTLPILYVFLARSGMTIHGVELLALDPDGVVHAADTARTGAGWSAGVKVAFSRGEERHRTLYYFQTDLSNHGVKQSGFLKFCEQLGVADGFVKSASYLMHMDAFSTVRDFLLARSQTLVQDDSGIPVRFFRPDDWELKPYGRYVGPIPMFEANRQPRLADLFRRQGRPLEFGVGYRWRPHESNLLVAFKKTRTVARD